MTEADLHVLLMGYLDGELDEAARARVEAALAADPALRRELAEMRRLKEATAGLGVDRRTDTELDAFWGDVYNRLERHTAWVLLVAGFAGIVVSLAYLFFTHPDTHWSIKAAAACGVVGTLLLLWSVWRERRRLLPHDRYSREVHR
ncbi:MAG: zf-HC2 domain-containing protein [Planctomycetota bacterium]|jgi:ferric-dicitrate binding protein FerR (iron transport regulator)